MMGDDPVQSAGGETARLRIALARIVRPQVDEADVIGRHPDCRFRGASAPTRALSFRSRRSPSTVRRASVPQATGLPLVVDRRHRQTEDRNVLKRESWIKNSVAG
jgi:hypothetical protein